MLGRVSTDQIFLATRNLQILMAAGIQIAPALGVLADTTGDRRLAEALGGCRRKVEEGWLLSAALGQHSGIFPSLYRSMVAVGESTGSLHLALEHLAGYLHGQARVRRDLARALTYPCVVLAFTALLSWVFLSTVLPAFARVFEDLRAPLPWLTRFVLGVAQFVSHPGVWVAVAALGLNAVGAARAWSHSRLDRRRLHGWLSMAPGLGSLLRTAAAARFCSAMHLQLASGVDMLGSLRIAGPASDFAPFEEAVGGAVDRLKGGETVSRSLRDALPPSVIHLLAAGEATGRLPAMFGRVAAMLELDLQHRIEVLTAVLEPLLLMLVSVLVGLVVVSMFLPLYSQLAAL